jgi:hypothetical protein
MAKKGGKKLQAQKKVEARKSLRLSSNHNEIVLR